VISELPHHSSEKQLESTMFQLSHLKFDSTVSANRSCDDVCDPMKTITGSDFTTDRFATHLKQLSSEVRGGVLKRTGAEYKWRYQFVNPLLQPYILMRGLDAGMITDDKLYFNTQADAKYPLFKGKKR
jgi:hypothetical protein